MIVKVFTIGGCRECPHCATKLTKGYGYAEDYICKAPKTYGRKIAGYVEWDSQAPQPGDFPEWCPLEERNL